MKLSIIIPVAGNNHFRTRNFEQCLKAIAKQDYKNYEIIVVEQSIDNRFYKSESKEYKLIQIKDPQRRGFNLSWCRNVGARAATGDKLVLMDADMVFEHNYFEAIASDKSPFAGGAFHYYWLRDEDPTLRLITSWDFNSIYKEGSDNHLDKVFKFETFTNGCGYGAVLIFDKKWYFESFGGYCEDFFKYGWEDKAAIDVIKDLLEIKNDREIPKIKYNVVHLGHSNKDYTNLRINEDLFESIKKMDKNNLISLIKSSNIGDITEPILVLNKCQ